MKMDFKSNQDAVMAIREVERQMPAPLLDSFTEQSTKSNTPGIVGAAEFIYVHRAALPVEVLQIGIDLFSYVISMEWWGFQDGSGQTRMAYLRKAAGITLPGGGAWPDDADAPAVMEATGVAPLASEVVEEPVAAV
jgi:hypothetical protein